MEEALEKSPSHIDPCILSPPYDPQQLKAFVEQQVNAIKQVEAWEDEYWSNLNQAMMDNTPMKMVTRSISRSYLDTHTVPTFDLGISQIEEKDALLSEEVRGIGHKRKVTDDVLSPDNDDNELNVRYYVKELPSESSHMCCYSNNNIVANLKEKLFDSVEDTTSDDVSLDNDFEDAPPTTKNNAKKKVDIASSPPQKKQKQTKKVMTQKTVPRRTLPKESLILKKRKYVLKPTVKPKPSNVPTDVPSSSKSNEESILAKQFAIFQESVDGWCPMAYSESCSNSFACERMTPLEFFTGGQGVPNQEFDIVLLRTRYTALLWNYGKKNDTTSYDEALAKMHRPITDWDNIKDITIL
ncbi:hypothetical protein FXO37_04129 [Capsicum annuum]|nr:hypothetical protein FXO37_04129 [Capsicum annuum]